MAQQLDKKQLINTLKKRLECELVLGGRWLPGGKLDLTAAKENTARLGRTPQVKMPFAAGGREIVEKQQRLEAVGGAGKETVEEQQRLEAVGGAGRETVEKQQRLEAVAAAVRKCSKCPLHETRTQGVPGEGHPDARIVFVGEAPGADEDAQGRPFVGRAGKLLTSIIEAMGLRREDVFIGNILKSRPPGNRDPLASEIAACIDYLYEQLEIIRPEIIVALGAYAAQALLERADAIGKLRGRVHEYYPHPMSEPIKLVATYHPAYLLRNYSPDTRRRIWEDMKLVLKELDLPIPQSKK